MPFGNGYVLISPEQQLMLHMHNKIPWKYGIYGLHLSVLDAFSSYVVRHAGAHRAVLTPGRGHVAAGPPISEMKSRRLIASPGAYEHRFKLAYSSG
jgi:hypothetical protein